MWWADYAAYESRKILKTASNFILEKNCLGYCLWPGYWKNEVCRGMTGKADKLPQPYLWFSSCEAGIKFQMPGSLKQNFMPLSCFFPFPSFQAPKTWLSLFVSPYTRVIMSSFPVVGYFLFRAAGKHPPPGPTERLRPIAGTTTCNRISSYLPHISSPLPIASWMILGHCSGLSCLQRSPCPSAFKKTWRESSSPWCSWII